MKCCLLPCAASAKLARRVLLIGVHQNHLSVLNFIRVSEIRDQFNMPGCWGREAKNCEEHQQGRGFDLTPHEAVPLRLSGGATLGTCCYPFQCLFCFLGRI